MTEWKEIELVECTDNSNISYGIVQPGQHMDDGVPIIRVNNFENGILNVSNVIRVKPEIADKHRKTRLQGGEVLLTIVGSTGQTAIVPTNLRGWNVARAVAVIRPKQNIGAKWINLWLQSNITKHHLDSRANTTVQKTLNLSDVKNIPFKIPPSDERRAIEHVLYSLDDKIALNRKMNQSLEAMAQALFKSWFVDFDPVLDNALAAGAPIPQPLQAKAQRRAQVPQAQKLLQQNPELAKEFPSTFCFNETLKQWIPEGWEVKNIDAFCEKIQNGGTPKRNVEEYWKNGKIPWLSSGEVRQGVLIGTKNFITQLGLENSSAKWVKELSTLVAMYGATAGQVAISSIQMTTNQAVCSLIPLKAKEFFVYINVLNKVSYLESQARGSAQQNISKGIIQTLNVLSPASSIISSFNKSTGSFYSKYFRNESISNRLSQLRDTLLPQLISGKLRLPKEMVAQFEAMPHSTA